ncbi:exodeoxyribonuclease VII small subunit [Hymenobacter sp. HMF4947]|uniref:Exodeoxyribonuclease 7 small subunit n=1 Tax=Hymenobacter ginkgonis TaxID=2682976 RepID=A0A7K1TAJ0_9BACT|nr:exodeoxyribonuclease VII small subunit [Hymenobacter ginkgonis]
MIQTEVTYNEAIQELETILRSLETDQVDVDDLTARAERSAELIRLCRHKLRHAEASLDRVFDSLDEEETEPEEDDEDLDDDDLAEDDSEDDDAEDDDYQPGGPGRPAQPRLF